MENLKRSLGGLFILLFIHGFAQVQIDRQIQLTGSGANAKLSGIQNVSQNQDAVSVDYIQRDSLKFGLASGSPNAYVVNLNPAVTSAYSVGMTVNFLANFGNTGVATLNVNGLGPVTIKKYFNLDLTGCEIQPGQLVAVEYDGTNFQIMSPFNPLSTLAGTPVATASSGVTSSQFTANWNQATDAIGYYLDVATDSNFTNFVSGFNNLNVGNVLMDSVTGLSCTSPYYYRVRSYNVCGISSNSNTMPATVVGGCPITQTECGHTFTYYAVTSATGRVWLDRNLGASEVATSSTDYNAYGSMFEWGRLADGHECINWTSSTQGTTVEGTTTDLSSTDVPPNALYISGGSDWRSPANDNLWQGANGINNPCPSGFRVATNSEWLAEMATWSSQNGAGAFNSPLKFTVAGVRNTDGTLNNDQGSYGFYWTSTVSDPNAYNSFFGGTNSATTAANSRTYGFPVRCIEN